MFIQHLLVPPFLVHASVLAVHSGIPHWGSVAHSYPAAGTVRIDRPSFPCAPFSGFSCRARRADHPAESRLQSVMARSVSPGLAVCPCALLYVAACQFGLPLPKAWAFWCNFDLGCRCPHPPRFHPSFAGKRNSDGSFATRQTACYPQLLAEGIALSVQHFLSILSEPVPFTAWRQFLPATFIWPIASHRIEDGAGTCSSAFWGVPREADSLGRLRALWLRRLETPRLLSFHCLSQTCAIFCRSDPMPFGIDSCPWIRASPSA